MIYIDIDNDLFYDDANILVKSFYPRTEVGILKADSQPEKDDLVINIQTPEVSGVSKREVHDIFKESLYLMLKDKTGKTLPWGYLTGVRPSKTALMMLEDNVSEEDILHEFTDVHFADINKARLAISVAKNELRILKDLDYKNGYSLYIGIPFCPSICLYCSFSSYSVENYKDRTDEYLSALIKEMHFVSDMMSGKRLDTVYIGGGTPTTLSAKQLDRLLTELDNLFDMDVCRELTVEAGRPDSVTFDKLKVLKAHNVGRISINPQTMNQQTLDLIGRRHTVEQVEEAYRMALDAGFDNINMDMILGLPNEGIDEVANTLKRISSLGPASLTVHSLALKRASSLNIMRDKFKELSIENTDNIIKMTSDTAEKLGLMPYYMYRQKNMAGNFENVGYAASGKECIYNILIMEEKQTIIACGAGASSKIVFHDENRIERIENVKNVSDYVARIDEMIERKRAFFEENFKKL